MPETFRRVSATKSLLAATAALFASITVGSFSYRGPAPLDANVAPDRPAAGRMRNTLVQLLGDPPMIHTTATEEGEAFLQRLESTIASYGVSSRRIAVAFDRGNQKHHPRGPIDLLPADTVLQNLLATVPGKDPSLAPILVATHHDSCRWGPGAGDAGSGVVTLVEHLRLLSQRPPHRTTHYLFTDGEEFGLLGAYALATLDELPFRRPVFVLNFDARGTRGGVPMFETHDGNAPWVKELINDLAVPRITSSLAVTVYRSLPNATDFNVWRDEFDWQGFNFATIGGAHHYHRPSDSPENLSDRTLQHMADHLTSLHQAIDRLDDSQAARLKSSAEDPRAANAVFFDLYGLTVVHYRSGIQLALAGVVLAVIACCWWRSKAASKLRRGGWSLGLAVLAILAGGAIGVASQFAFRFTPWANLRYTPVDLIVGLTTIGAAFLAATLAVEFLFQRASSLRSDSLGDDIWLAAAVLAVAAAVVLPGGGYLLLLAAAAFAVVRVVTQSPGPAAWAGWLTAAILFGPVLVLLVQALGPWQQPLYGLIAGLLAAAAIPTWTRVVKPAAPQSAHPPRQS